VRFSTGVPAPTACARLTIAQYAALEPACCLTVSTSQG
jgi:hypothetical protein